MEHDLEKFCFHDNLIHGIIFYSDPGEFSSDIALDIDYIVEWVKTDSNEIEFIISKALLKFHDVTDLKISIEWDKTNYSKFSGGAAGLYINEIIKKEIKSPIANSYFTWEITTNKHNRYISFGASSFSIEMLGEPKKANRQFLLRCER